MAFFVLNFFLLNNFSLLSNIFLSAADLFRVLFLFFALNFVTFTRGFGEFCRINISKLTIDCYIVYVVFLAVNCDLGISLENMFVVFSQIENHENTNFHFLPKISSMINI